MNPLVSIIVPCYNQGQFLSETLESVNGQIYQNWECILLNDGSEDNTEEVIKEWLEKDKRFIYVKKDNSGVCDTRNKGISLSKGKYILPLDSDDKIAPEYVIEAVNELEKDSNLKLVYCNVTQFGVINKRVKDIPYSYERMLSGNLIQNAAIFRRRDFDKTKGYNLNMQNGLEDWDFWISFLKPQDKVLKLKGVYFYYRIKTISRSTEIDFEKNERLILQIFKNNQDRYLEFYNPIRDHINHLHYKNEYLSLQQTKEYKVGRIIFYPLHFIKKVWKKIW